jgi:long-subunit fatty acid transport protein
MRPAGRAFLFAAVFSTALLPAAARAGGYDTPMLYSARHMGMGGTAIGYVNDPSAMFHNPAGLAHTRSFGVIGDFTLLTAKVHSSPTPLVKDVDSKTTIAPLGLLGGGVRLNETVTVGLAVYPNALAGATYRYTSGDLNIEDRTRLVFFEASPAVALNLPGRVRLGAGYRATYVNLQRFQGDPDRPPQALNFEMSGFNWLSFRAGAQWTPVDWLQVGAVYRHKTSTKVKNDKGVALAMEFTDIDTTFVLPARAGLGARADLGDFGLAVDGEYAFNSQNDAYPLNGTLPAKPVVPATPTSPEIPGQPAMRLSVPNVFDWKDEITVRGGLEYRLLPAASGGVGRLALRAGYVYDGKTTNPHYPSAFGTPPGPTHVITGGIGWNGGAWQLNAAYGRRFGEGAVTPADVMDPNNRPCRFCGSAGNDPYRIGVNGFYLDFSYAL